MGAATLGITDRRRLEGAWRSADTGLGDADRLSPIEFLSRSGALRMGQLPPLAYAGKGSLPSRRL